MAEQQGNPISLRHGGHAVIAPVEMEAVVTAIREALPIKHQADQWIVADLADALIRLHRFRNYADEHELWDQRGKSKKRYMARSVLHWESRYRDRVFRLLLRELGLTPASRAKLGLDLVRSVSLAEAMSEKDPVKRKALMAAAGVPEEDGADGWPQPTARSCLRVRCCALALGAPARGSGVQGVHHGHPGCAAHRQVHACRGASSMDGHA